MQLQVSKGEVGLDGPTLTKGMKLGYSVLLSFVRPHYQIVRWKFLSSSFACSVVSN